MHLLALAPAGVGVCCLAADRRRSRGAELVMGGLMLAAMIDAVAIRAVPTVWWTALLIVAALALVAGHRRTRGRASDAPGERAMVVHTALGMIVMGALMLTMASGGTSEARASVAAASGHAHGVAAIEAVVLLGWAYVVVSVGLAVRTRSALVRAQYAAMAASTGLMSVAMLV